MVGDLVDSTILNGLHDPFAHTIKYSSPARNHGTVLEVRASKDRTPKLLQLLPVPGGVHVIISMNYCPEGQPAKC